MIIVICLFKIFSIIIEDSYCDLKAFIGSIFDVFIEGNRPAILLKVEKIMLLQDY
jgi:hypothetical protein